MRLYGGATFAQIDFMTTRFKSFILSFLLFALAATSIHCSKSGEDAPQPPDNPRPDFTISFPEESIPATSVDSAIISFSNELKDTIRKKAFVENGQIALQSHLPAGTWTVYVKLFTKMQADGSARMYRIEKPILFQNGTTTIQGPTSKLYGGQWKPNIVLTEQQYGTRLITAERPEDPYYELFLPGNHNFHYLYIDRAAYDHSRDISVAYDWKTYSPGGQYRGTITDSSFFKAFAQQLGAQHWDDWDLFVKAGIVGQEEKTLFYWKTDKRP